MEWTIQQIVAVVIGAIAASIILYAVISQIGRGTPPPQIPTQALPILFSGTFTKTKSTIIKKRRT